MHWAILSRILILSYFLESNFNALVEGKHRKLLFKLSIDDHAKDGGPREV